MSDSISITADLSFDGEALQASATSTLDAAIQSQGPRRFKVNAYTGGMIRQEWSREPVIVDLQGMTWTNKRRPILLQHSYELDAILGQTTDIRVEGKNLVVEGEMIGGNSSADKVIGLAERGFQWQASIGADVLRAEKLPAGETATVNGQSVTGPARIVRASKLREVSVVTLGADDNTSASLAASAAQPEESFMSDESREAVDATNETIVANTPATPVIDEEAIAERVAAKVLAAQAESKAQVIRAARPSAPAIHVEQDRAQFSDVLMAAACQSGRLPGLEKEFEPQVLEAAHKKYKGGIGLGEMLIEAARANGYAGRTTFRDDSYSRPILRAAFATHDIADILSATVNKFLLQGFTTVDTTWQRISTTRSVADFKTVTSYRLTGGFKFEEMSGKSEFKMAQAGDVTYQNSARTYGIATNVTREDIINDDLGALTAVPTRIGRGAALKLNEVFWGRFLDNSTFFTSGNKNVASGASSAFGIDGITAAELLFLNQTDDDGFPLAVSPSIMLVPTSLNARALQLRNSTEVRDTTGSTKYPTANPHAGKYEILTCPYLSNSLFTGNSTTAYYLLASPADLTTIEVCFLNGVQQPTVEQADLDFSVLGIQMRGYFDFGCAMVEPRGGVKMVGA
jgi:phage major head subunit gpT-like protein/phage head maturation protease